MKVSLCVEAGERPQWPRLYSLGRPTSHDCMPSLVSDHDPVLSMQGWALAIEYITYHWCYTPVHESVDEWLYVEQSHEVFTNIKGRGGVSNTCFHS